MASRLLRVLAGQISWLWGAPKRLTGGQNWRLWFVLAAGLAFSSMLGPAAAWGFTHNYGTGGPNTDTHINAVVVDISGNEYVAGDFQGSTLTLGAFTLTKKGYVDAFVAKLDAGGNVIWAKSFGGSNSFAYGRALAVNSSGNLFLGGDFSTSTLTTPALTMIGSQDAFVIKLDIATGAITWAKNFGGSGPTSATVFGNALAVDSSGNPFLGGYFFNASLSSPPLTKTGYVDAFVIKLDPDGNVAWAQDIGSGMYTTAVGNALAVDSAGNAYLGGDFYGGDIVKPAMTKLGFRDAFVIKLNGTTGTAVWSQNFGGSSNANTYVNALALDSAGIPYLGGEYYDAALTKPMLPQIGTKGDAFVFKLDPATGTTGTVTYWATNFGGSGNAGAGTCALAVDSSGDPFVGGVFYSDLTTPPISSFGGTDAFIFKLDQVSGAVTWAQNFGGAGTPIVSALAVDSSGIPYLGGFLFNGNLVRPALTKIGSADAFIISADTSTQIVNYVGNGNTGGFSPADFNIYTTGQTVTVLGNTGNLTRTGFTFSGWKTAADGSGASFVAGDTFTIGSTNVRLYAQWAFAAPIYTVTYRGNGNTGGSVPTDSSVYTTGMPVTVLGLTGSLTRTGYDFDGWNTAPDGSGTSYFPNDTFPMGLENLTLYAKWVKTAFSHNYGYTWGSTQINAVAVDASGNKYIAGNFSGHTLTMGAVTLTRIGNYDAFIAKLNAKGDVIWAKNFGGSNTNVYAQALSVDNSGTPYLAGYFVGANYNIPSLTSPVLPTIGNQDAFVFKLDPATGNTGSTTYWAKNFGGAQMYAAANALAIDSSGTPYLGGEFYGYSSNRITTPALTLIGSRDAFVFKLNPATGSTGTTTYWAKNFGGSSASTVANALAVDGSGIPYLGGYFGNTNLTSPALTMIGLDQYDAFVFKLDPATGTTGTATYWAKNYGGYDGYFGTPTYGTALAVDSSGVPYLGGYFDMRSLTAPSLARIGEKDAFVFKLDPVTGTTGTATYWAKNFGGSGASAYGNALAVDSSGNPQLGGSFVNSKLTTPDVRLLGDQDAFLIKLDGTTGAVTYAQHFGGGGMTYTYGQALAVDSSDTTYLAGKFSFGGLGIPPLNRIGYDDAFIVALDQPTYTVTYSGNGNTGGSVPIDNVNYTAGRMVTVRGNTGALYRSGYSFLEWNTDAAGTGTPYSGGDTFPMGSGANVTLYAQWTSPSPSPVRILETSGGYADIQAAATDVKSGQTIQAQSGSGGSNFDFTGGVFIELSGGYDLTFTDNSGATLVSGSLTITTGGITIENIIIQ